ncbi:MAG: tryptophan 2,3-dioxygenase [Methanobacteriota archaeon]|nr:MAG: tryptophan 2,3-dioxygenase [Euryarchaeota archaeon]|tara:strand:+ start:3712 stop:4782 length:1071 start_codon:yes stop_codon:yes gene_type:complete
MWGLMSGGGYGDWTYSEYLNLHELLGLQGEDREVSADEMHFIIVHQTFELWFKQVIKELSEVRDILGQVPVPEDEIPRAVEHLGRTTEIFRLMASQWTVLETLTPQGFLAFRDGLGSASGFESFQMRQFEILLGLDNNDRIGGMDPLDSFRRMAERGEEHKEVLSMLEDAASRPSLVESLMLWVERTPIMGSGFESDNDQENVQQYVEAHLKAHKTVCDLASDSSEMMAARMKASHESAISFLKPDGTASRRRAGLLFIESYRELPLLAWPRKLIDAVVELEESMVKWRHSHARMVERIMGRRIGTGGTSGVDYLDATAEYRIFKDLWAVRTILVKPQMRPELVNSEFYGYNSSNE